MTTFGFGGHAEMLKVALPTFAEYAKRHGYDLFVPEEGFFGPEHQRPASWKKIPLLKSLFGMGYDVALWLDADVVIRKFDKDIADDCGERPMHMVVHNTHDGAVPNCGVWYVRSSFAQYLDDVWGRCGFIKTDCWWEQAAVISLLGGDPDAASVSVPGGPLWAELPYEWNPHARDARSFPAETRFFHATAIEDRVRVMKGVVDGAT